MNLLLPDIPSFFESENLHLRTYRAGDGPCYYEVSQRNQQHLRRYESDNVVMGIKNEEEAETIVRDLAADWLARKNFFVGVFDKRTGHFIAQVYIGPVNWDLPEFQIGFFVDIEYEGLGYMTEAIKASLRFAFHRLNAYRIGAECDETNTRSARLLERCGMVKEGLLRENKKNADGTISGTLFYSLLRKEY